MPAFRRGTYCVRTRLHMFAARLHDTQSTLFHDVLLSLPADYSPPLPYSELLDPELLLFSGSIYFEGREEERAYCCFLGLRPHPRIPPNTPDGATAATSTTFCGIFVPKKERAAFDGQLASRCRFEQNPIELAKAIVQTRLERLPTGSHLASILLRSTKNFD